LKTHYQFVDFNHYLYNFNNCLKAKQKMLPHSSGLQIKKNQTHIANQSKVFIFAVQTKLKAKFWLET